VYPYVHGRHAYTHACSNYLYAFVCVCVYICVCMGVCMCIYICIMSVYVCVFVCTYMHIHKCASNTLMHITVSICVCVCVCVFIGTYAMPNKIDCMMIRIRSSLNCTQESMIDILLSAELHYVLGCIAVKRLRSIYLNI
jgi:ABC-type proline/glycine betaine transport system permease subunit